MYHHPSVVELGLRTLPEVEAKMFDACFCWLLLTATLLNGRDYTNDFAIKAFEHGDGFHIVR